MRLTHNTGSRPGGTGTRERRQKLAREPCRVDRGRRIRLGIVYVRVGELPECPATHGVVDRAAVRRVSETHDRDAALGCDDELAAVADGEATVADRRHRAVAAH